MLSNLKLKDGIAELTVSHRPTQLFKIYMRNIIRCTGNSPQPESLGAHKWIRETLDMAIRI